MAMGSGKAPLGSGAPAIGVLIPSWPRPLGRNASIGCVESSAVALRASTPPARRGEGGPNSPVEAGPEAVAVPWP